MSSATTKKRNTSAKGRTASKGKQSKKNSRSGKQAENSFIKAEVILLLVLAFSILLLLSNFGFGGKAGSTLSRGAFGLFGIMSYPLPLALFFGCGLFLSNRDNYKVLLKLVSGVFLFLFLCVLAQLLTKSYIKAGDAASFYAYSSEFKTGGGLLGGFLCHAFISGFGAAGAYVLTIILMIISLVIITEKSFFRGVKKGGSKVYSTAKAESDRHREKIIQKQAAAREKRTARKAEGVSMNTSLPVKKTGKKADIHEVTMDFPPEPSLASMPVERSAPVTEPFIQTPVPEVFEAEPLDAVSPVEADIFVPKREPEMHEIFMPEAAPAGQEAIEIVRAEPASQKRREQVKAEALSAGPADIAAELSTGNEEGEKEYIFPSVELLKKGKARASGDSDMQLRETAAKLQQTLQNFGVRVTVTNISCGPTVTRYELQPDQGVKVSKIVGLADDIKLNLAAADIRIEAPIPGKAAVGIEVPNKENSVVMFRELLESDEFLKHPSGIAFAAGKDIGGRAVVADIAKMPHLLIAGATGSGKSVCINTLIMSILYKAKPEDVKLIMIDPKVVELSVYNGIPHLLIPVVTDPKKAAGALNWAVAEMTDRYKKFADLNVRDLKGYNEKIQSIENIEDDNKPQKLPQIVIIVDELADLMMVAPGEVEDAICRLAQLARAAGLHLIIATQRPSVNVITGLIKANMPSRIAFAVSSGVDSRTIIDMNGAEKLLGKGDMLFYPQGYQKPARVQGAFVSDKEVSDVVEFLTSHHGVQAYSQEIESSIQAQQQSGEAGSPASERDAYFVEAGKFIIEKDKASIGMLQRMFKVGFNRAARIMDQLCEAGVVGEEEGTKPRKVLMSMEEFQEFVDEYI